MWGRAKRIACVLAVLCALLAWPGQIAQAQSGFSIAEKGLFRAVAAFTSMSQAEIAQELSKPSTGGVNFTTAETVEPGQTVRLLISVTGLTPGSDGTSRLFCEFDFFEDAKKVQSVPSQLCFQQQIPENLNGQMFTLPIDLAITPTDEDIGEILSLNMRLTDEGSQDTLPLRIAFETVAP
ncbi:MAG: hypothetical protein AAGD04_09615 [Pseudomonadota bacterium]